MAATREAIAASRLAVKYTVVLPLPLPLLKFRFKAVGVGSNVEKGADVDTVGDAGSMVGAAETEGAMEMLGTELTEGDADGDVVGAVGAALGKLEGMAVSSARQILESKFSQRGLKVSYWSYVSKRATKKHLRPNVLAPA